MILAVLATLGAIGALLVWSAILVLVGLALAWWAQRNAGGTS